MAAPAATPKRCGPTGTRNTARHACGELAASFAAVPTTRQTSETPPPDVSPPPPPPSHTPPPSRWCCRSAAARPPALAARSVRKTGRSSCSRTASTVGTRVETAPGQKQARPPGVTASRVTALSATEAAGHRRASGTKPPFPRRSDMRESLREGNSPARSNGHAAVRDIIRVSFAQRSTSRGRPQGRCGPHCPGARRPCRSGHDRGRAERSARCAPARPPLSPPPPGALCWPPAPRCSRLGPRPGGAPRLRPVSSAPASPRVPQRGEHS